MVGAYNGNRVGMRKMYCMEVKLPIIVKERSTNILRLLRLGIQERSEAVH